MTVNVFFPPRDSLNYILMARKKVKNEGMENNDVLVALCAKLNERLVVMAESVISVKLINKVDQVHAKMAAL